MYLFDVFILYIFRDRMLLGLYSHDQKYWHACNSVRKCNPSLRKLLLLQMFWYSHVHFFGLHWNNAEKQREKVKSDTIPHRNPKRHWPKLWSPLT